jgi:hypothetical protein
VIIWHFNDPQVPVIESSSTSVANQSFMADDKIGVVSELPSNQPTAKKIQNAEGVSSFFKKLLLKLRSHYKLILLVTLVVLVTLLCCLAAGFGVYANETHLIELEQAAKAKAQPVEPEQPSEPFNFAPLIASLSTIYMISLVFTVCYGLTDWHPDVSFKRRAFYYIIGFIFEQQVFLAVYNLSKAAFKKLGKLKKKMRKSLFAIPLLMLMGLVHFFTVLSYFLAGFNFVAERYVLKRKGVFKTFRKEQKDMSKEYTLQEKKKDDGDYLYNADV